jgi:hypothetical protein
MICTSKSTAPLNRSRPIEQTRPIDLYTKIQSTFYVSLFIVFSCHALAALGFGSSLLFCAEKRSVLLHESEGFSLLCSESIRSSLRKHDGYPNVARRFCVPTLSSRSSSSRVNFSSELHKPVQLQLSSLGGKWAVIVVDRSSPRRRTFLVRAESEPSQCTCSMPATQHLRCETNWPW